MFRFRTIFSFTAEGKITPVLPKVPHKKHGFNRRMAGCANALGVAAMALTLGLSGCGGNSASSSTSTPALVVSPSVIDFGDVNVGTSLYQTVSVTNTGTSPVQVAQLSTSTSVFTANAGVLPATLAAGSSMKVQVGFDPGSATDATGQLSVSAITSAKSTVASTVKLHGNGHATSSGISLAGLSCASSSMIGAGTDACYVTLTVPAPSGGFAVAIASSSAAVTVPVSVSVPAGTASASFVANVSAVASSQTVTLTATEGNGSKATSINLSGTGATETPTVSAVSCNATSITGPMADSCTVSLSGPAPAGGLSVALGTSNAAVSMPSSVTVPAGATSAAFTANVAPVSSTQSVTLTATAGSSSKAVSLQLNAASAALNLSATSLSFGNVSVGTAVTKSVTVTSSGTVAVTIKSDSVTGTGYSVSGGSFPATLNPGQAMVLTVQFDPSTASSATGQLTLSSNAPAATVSLSGTGTTVTPTVSAVSCGSTSITGSLADTCTVSLTGSAPTGGVSVSLASSSSAVTVPSSVTVPATASSASFTANAAAVSSAQSATLTATTGGTSKAVSLQLNAAASALTLNATSISFGGAAVNTPTTQTVTLTSSGTAAVTVNSVTATGSGFSVSSPSLPATLNPGQAMTVTLTFNPSAVGAATGQLTISSNSSTNPTLTVPLSGTGNPLQVDLSWNAPTGSSDPIAGYKVYRAPGGTSSFAVLGSMDTQTAYTDANVQSGQSYIYYVTSVDSSGTESSPSNTTTVAIP